MKTMRLMVAVLLVALAPAVWALCGCSSGLRALPLNGCAPFLWQLTDANGNQKPWPVWNSYVGVSDGDYVIVVYPPHCADTASHPCLEGYYTTCPDGQPHLWGTSLLTGGVQGGKWRVHIDCQNSVFTLTPVEWYPNDNE